MYSNIFYFNVINVKKDNKTVERVEIYNNDFKEPRRFKLDNGILKGLLDNKNNLFVGWDNREQFNSLKPKTPYLDYCKAYSKIILNNINDCRSLTELKQTHDIKNMSDTQAMQLIDNEKKITDKIMELMETTGIGKPNKVLFPSACLESYITKNRILISSNNDNTNKSYNLGGLNIIGENKRYENLKHFDVNSFYPNMLISLQASSNLDYLNLKCSTVKELTGDWELINETKGTAFYMQNDGLKQAKKLSNGEYKVLELDSNFDLTESNKDICNLVSQLLEYKENNTGNLRIAYKTLVNGLYGALDSEKYFKYNHVNLMAVTTFLCRYVLYNCYKEFNGVYAKTDSIWTTNKDLTEDELNNYSNDLLNSIGIPNACISWELESEPDKLLIKDSNNYIEVIGDEYNFKGGYDAPIQEIALKKAIENKRVDINQLFDDYKDQIPLFCKHPKYSTSQENQDRFNKVLTEIKSYTIEPDKKCYQYFSIRGWVNGLEIDQFNLEVDRDYGLNLITKILYDYGFMKYIYEFNITEKYKAPKFVPMKLKYGGNRLIQDNSRLDRLFRTNINKYPVVERLQKLILPYKANYQYIGFIVGTNYYAIDIDTDHDFNVETVKNEILKLFDKTQYILHSSKSNGYHIIFKTDNDLTGFEVKSTIEGYKGLELLRNKPVPYNNKYFYENKPYEYKVIKYNRRNANDIIDALGQLEPFNKIDELKRFYGYDETKKTKEIIPVNDNVKDFKELDTLTSQLVELSDRLLDGHNKFSLTVGGSLRGLLNTQDIEQLAIDLDKSTDNKNVRKETIIYGYKRADPTNSLGLLKEFIGNQPNGKDLMEVFNMISGIFKNNTDNNDNDKNNNLKEIIKPVLDELESIHQTDTHINVRCPILYNCMAYLSEKSMNEVIDILKTTGTNTANTRQSLENAYREGKPNKWAVYWGLGCLDDDLLEMQFESDEITDERQKEPLRKQNEERKNLYFDFKEKLELYAINAYTEMNKLLEIYEKDLIRLYDNKLLDYVDNSKNILKGVINCLGALMGYCSRILVVNGGSEAGKSEYVKTINKIVPDFLDMGSSTPATIRRSEEGRFNRKIVYIGDKGLKGVSQNSKDEFEGLYEVFGSLVTDGKFTRDVVEGKEVLHFVLKTDGLIVFFTQPYTNLNVFGAGDQYKTRSTYITVNPVKNPVQVFLQSDNIDNSFHQLHQFYIKYLMKNPIGINLTDKLKTNLLVSCNYSLRIAKYVKGLFTAYCQFLRINEPTLSDLDKFLELFTVNMEISEIEYLLYKLLYNNLKKINKSDINKYLDKYGSVKDENLILKQRANRKEKIFFTASKIKTYFKTEMKMNKNLKDTIDNVPEMLRNIYNGGYIETIDEKSHNGENIYYIPFNDGLEKENKE